MYRSVSDPYYGDATMGAAHADNFNEFRRSSFHFGGKTASRIGRNVDLHSIDDHPTGPDDLGGSSSSRCLYIHVERLSAFCFPLVLVRSTKTRQEYISAMYRLDHPGSCRDRGSSYLRIAASRVSTNLPYGGAGNAVG